MKNSLQGLLLSQLQESFLEAQTVEGVGFRNEDLGYRVHSLEIPVQC